MTEGPIPWSPPRIAEEGGTAGSLLRSSGPAFQANLSESGAWRKLDERRQRRATRARVLTVAAVSAAFCAAVLGMKFRSSRYTLPLSPEPAPVALTAERPTLPAPPEEQPSAERVPEERASAPLVVQTPRTETPSEAACSRWSSAGQTERAFDCYRARSRGHGVEAEVALYQAARVSAEKLNDPRRALALLDEHKKRFPEGAMRGEVEWLRVRSLKRAGHLDEALQASEALLATPTGRTLASELHLVRGRIYQDEQNDCARATSEYVALLGEPGALGDEAELRRAACLEKLGRTDDAIAAYRQYLRRAQPAEPAKARERLRSLGGEQ